MLAQKLGDFFRMGFGDCSAAAAEVFDRFDHRLGHFFVGLGRPSDEIETLTLRDSFMGIFAV
jgi:hypothetical protein